MLLIPVQAHSPSSDRPTPERETVLAHHRRRRRLFLQSPSSSSSRRTSTKTTTNTSKTTTLDTPRRRDDRVGIASSHSSSKDDDDVGVDDAHHRRRRRPSRERTRASSSSSYSSPSPSPSSACLARDRPPVVRFGSVPRASRADDFDPRPDPIRVVFFSRSRRTYVRTVRENTPMSDPGSVFDAPALRRERRVDRNRPRG